MERREKIVAGAAIGLVVYTMVLGMLGPLVLSAFANRTVPNTGSVKAIGVEVYSDLACTNIVSSINWGMIDPGANKNVTVYIKNTGNSPVTLAKATSNWNPANAASYMNLAWNYAGQVIDPNAVRTVKFTLAVSSSITGISNFSFDTTITASE